MIGLSTKTFDMNGDILLDELKGESNINTTARRVTKTRTLDGDVDIEDRGYTPKDRAFTIQVNATLELRAILLNMLTFHNNLTLTMEDGAFDVVPTIFNLEQSVFTLTFEAR